VYIFLHVHDILVIADVAIRQPAAN